MLNSKPTNLLKSPINNSVLLLLCAKLCHSLLKMVLQNSIFWWEKKESLLYEKCKQKVNQTQVPQKKVIVDFFFSFFLKRKLC